MLTLFQKNSENSAVFLAKSGRKKVWQNASQHADQLNGALSIIAKKLDVSKLPEQTGHKHIPFAL